jgi:hypothetical protein
MYPSTESSEHKSTFSENYFKKTVSKPGMVVHACNSNIREAEAGEAKFQVSLGCRDHIGP